MSLTIAQWCSMSDAEQRAERAKVYQAAASSAASHGTYISVASQCTESIGDGELHGVPFAVKDNIDVAGVPTTAGSPMFAEAIPATDAGVVSALREAGAIVVGKTNMHELAFGMTSNNGQFGPVRNPLDPALSAGGSSGGSAATVALGEVPFALSTDTGGSVIVPASFCGIVGFRPSTGRWAGDGVINLSWSRDTIGVHARTVEDVRTVDRVVTRAATRESNRGLQGLRIGLPASRWTDLDPEVEKIALATVARLQEFGVATVNVDIPHDRELADGAGMRLVLHEAAEAIRTRAAGSGRYDADVAFEELVGRIASTDVKLIAEAMVAQGSDVGEYEDARRGRWRLRRSYAETFETHSIDVMLAPTAVILPQPVGADETVWLNGQAHPLFPTLNRNSGPGSVAGVPMISLPAGQTPTGLSVGMCLEGRFFDDTKLLDIAATLETLLEPRVV